MPQSLSSILVHLIFSTKNRQAFLTPEVDKELYPYMGTTFRELDSPALAINSAADHIYSLFRLSRTQTVADLVEEVKKRSSKWIKTKGRDFAGFQWQRGCSFHRGIECQRIEELH